MNSKKNKQSNLKECTSGLALQSTSVSSVASLLLTGWAQFTFFLRGCFLITPRGRWLSVVGSMPFSSGFRAGTYYLTTHHPRASPLGSVDPFTAIASCHPLGLPGGWVTWWGASYPLRPGLGLGPALEQYLVYLHRKNQIQYQELGAFPFNLEWFCLWLDGKFSKG